MRRPGDVATSLLLSGAAALWLAAAIATLFAGPQYTCYHVDLAQDPDAGTRTGLVLFGAVLLMILAAAAAIVVAALMTIGSSAVRTLTRIVLAIAGVAALIVLVVGTPAGVTWHARSMTGVAVSTVLLLAAAAFVQLSSRRRAPRPVPESPLAPAASPSPTATPGSAPARSGMAAFWLAARVRDAPRWTVALGALAALAFAATAAVIGVRGVAPAGPPTTPVAATPASGASAHDVIYTVSAPGTVSWMEIVYVNGQGQDVRTTSVPTGLPWVEPIRTGPRSDLLYLAVTTAGKTPNTKIQCAIHVDGRRAIASEGPSCNVHVRLR